MYAIHKTGCGSVVVQMVAVLHRIIEYGCFFESKVGPPTVKTVVFSEVAER